MEAREPRVSMEALEPKVWLALRVLLELKVFLAFRDLSVYRVHLV